MSVIFCAFATLCVAKANQEIYYDLFSYITYPKPPFYTDINGDL